MGEGGECVYGTVCFDVSRIKTTNHITILYYVIRFLCFELNNVHQRVVYSIRRLDYIYMSQSLKAWFMIYISLIAQHLFYFY